MKKILFIDRDGTLALEPENYQLDSFDKLIFYPGVFNSLGKISRELDFELVMVTNQDGLGTPSFPENTFWPTHRFLLKCFENEEIIFDDIYIDKSLPSDNAPTRKPGIGLLKKYINNKNYDLENSYVIGDRLTDMELALNLGAKGIFISNDEKLVEMEISENLNNSISLKTTKWNDIYSFLKLKQRVVTKKRVTNETKINLDLNLDGNGESDINTGIAFFDHMLNQIARHGNMDIKLLVHGDLEVDEHHTIEDTAIALGKGFKKVLKDKMGIERYGFCLPMDDSLATVSLDFGGRSWLVWDVSFKREMIGKMPTEMFIHFFKSFSDESKSNLNIKAVGDNEHHKIESIFKAFAKAIKMAVKRDPDKMVLPTTKGIL